MTKIKQFTAVDRCLFWKEKKLLVIGDLHLGYEDSLAEGGVAIPFSQWEETEKGLKEILKETGKLDKVILLGDVKHFFGGVLSQEWRDFYLLVELLKEYLNKEGKIIITKGNHDNILEPVILHRKYDLVSLVYFFLFEDVLFFHGDKFSKERVGLNIFDKGVKLIVQGHLHPAIDIIEDTKKERYKCFLFGNLKKERKEVIVLPSFFPLVEGSDIQSKEFEGIKGKRVYVIADKVYDFGKIK